MEVPEAMRKVIDYLDEQMKENPSKELADVSNFLEDELSKLGRG